MKKALLLAALLAVVWFFNRPPTESPKAHSGSPAVQEDYAPATVAGTNLVAEAYANQASDVQVSGQGTVSRLLDDDHDGSRHQRFILRLDSDQTLLVAHNIDLAPRIDSLAVGDVVEFNGRNPSVENIANTIWSWLDGKLPGLKLINIRVYETPKTWAEVGKEEVRER